jgi:hypothetical protein
MTLGDPAATPSSIAQPAFHLAPVILESPDDTDRREPWRSATLAPRRVTVPPAFAQLSTRRLTPQVLEQVRATGLAPEGSAAAPMDDYTVTTYTPAQIRAAYGLPALPSTTASVSSAQAAQMGAGQTIYLIDAQNDPNIVAELTTFDSSFGLPDCTVTPIATTANLPLTAAPVTGCTLSIVYSDPNGVMTATVPAYDAGWATEIALDVEWAHATAPYARIMLIESPDAGIGNLTAAVRLANAMGAGVVSQSWGGPENSSTGSYDALYSVANMTYLAATGDAGAGVSFPAVSTHVVAVAGTSLTYSGNAPRSETVWSGTGAGVSAFVPAPAYQHLAVPGFDISAHRAVADVTFNANPFTGQYLVINTSSGTNWLSGGGTSLATPQWAGIIAVANALRAQNALAPLGAVQPALYGLGVQAGSYSNAFLDVTTGSDAIASDGYCATCSAGVGYDLPSGLGSPNVAGLLTALHAAPQLAPEAPVVTSALVSGKVGVTLSFSITATAADPLTYSLANAPAGMSVDASTGLVTWSRPVAGTYLVLATASDTSAGLSGQGSISVSISPALPPNVAGGSIAGTALTALSFVPQVTDADAVTLSLSGAPSGMSVNAARVVSWASPLAGTYEVTVIATDATTQLQGEGLYTVTIAPALAPKVTSESVKFASGAPISFKVTTSDTNPLTFSLTGEPAGMTISSTGDITWKTTRVGTFVVKVIAHDAKTGLSGTGVATVLITQSGPVIALTPLKGIAGEALTESIAFTDSTATVLSISVKDAPFGMSFAVSGKTLVAKWASPKMGSYSLKVTAVDSKKLNATAIIPVTIIAH